MNRIKFCEGSGWHQGWTLRDRQQRAVNLFGANLTFAVYVSTDPLTGSPTPWLIKDNGVNGSLVVTDPLNGVIRVDFDHIDTVDKAGVYPWELRLETPDDEERCVDRGMLILTARRLDTLDVP